MNGYTADCMFFRIGNTIAPVLLIISASRLHLTSILSHPFTRGVVVYNPRTNDNDNYRSLACDCSTIGNNTGSSATTFATTVNPNRNGGGGVGGGSTGNPGGTAPSILMTIMAGVGMSPSGGGCTCSSGTGTTINGVLSGVGANAVGGGAGMPVGSNSAISGNRDANNNEDATTSNAETLLSSNARFQAISAIAVAQDGVINIADQGKKYTLL